MKKPIAALLAMIIQSSTYAAEQPTAGRKKDDPSEVKKQQDSYEAAVGKCQSQSGAAKQECVEAAKTKYGEMLK